MKVTEKSWHWRLLLDSDTQQKALAGEVSITGYLISLVIVLFVLLIICGIVSVIFTGLLTLVIPMSLAAQEFLWLFITIIFFIITNIGIYFSYEKINK